MNISKIYDRLNRMAGEALGTGNPYKGFFQSPGATDVENDRWVNFRLLSFMPKDVISDQQEWEITLTCPTQEEFLALADQFIEGFTGQVGVLRREVDTGVYQESEASPVKGYWVSVTVLVS